MPAQAVIFVVGAFLCWGLGFYILKLSHCFNFLDHPGGRKQQSVPIAYGGGLLIFFGCLLQILIALSVYLSSNELFQAWFPEVHFDAILKEPKGLATFIGACSMLILGTWDDLRHLNPKIKLGAQIIIVSFVLWWGEMSMSFFLPIPWLGFIGTCIWVVLITNAFNLIDNMDGLCGGVSLITLALHLVLLHQGGHWMLGAVSLICMSSVCAFMFYNLPPARLYLGDSGSYFLGFLIAMLSVLSTYYHEGQSMAGILTPILILAVPLFDVITVLWIRTKNRKPWFVGDRNHFSHRLLDLGLSQMQSLLLILALSLACGLGGLLLPYVNDTMVVLIFAQTLIVLWVIHLLERASRKKSLSRKRPN